MFGMKKEPAVQSRSSSLFISLADNIIETISFRSPWTSRYHGNMKQCVVLEFYI